MNDAKDNALWTLNEDTPVFDDLHMGISLDELNDVRDTLRGIEVRKVRAAIKPVTLSHEERFDHTDQGQWWTKKKATSAPRTDALDAWVENQSKKGSGMRAFVIAIIALAIILTVGSFMVAQAQAGQAFMRFKIHTVTEETIIVMDEHEDFFTFYKEGSPDVKVGDEVIVCTDLTFTDGKWDWNRSRTAIIDVVR